MRLKARNQHSENLTANAATYCTCDRVADCTKIDRLRCTAGNISANRAANQLSDKVDQKG